jgi:hypothetical protein
LKRGLITAHGLVTGIGLRLDAFGYLMDYMNCETLAIGAMRIS